MNKVYEKISVKNIAANQTLKSESNAYALPHCGAIEKQLQRLWMLKSFNSLQGDLKS